MALQFSRAHNFLLEILKAGGFQRLNEKIGAIVLGGDFDQIKFAVLENFVPISAKILCLRGLLPLGHGDSSCIVLAHQNNEVLVRRNGYVYAPDIEK